MKRRTAISSYGALTCRRDIYDLYWRFAAERQAIFFRRLKGDPYPWTDDPIMQQFRFTNAYRASDRTSQFLIRNVIYGEKCSASATEVVFRILLFKFFNKETTWKLLEAKFGTPSWEGFSFQEYDRVLSTASAKGYRLYSGAYIIPPVSIDDSGVKYRGHLKLIELILSGDFVPKLVETRSLREVFSLLRSYPSLGEFLAYQLAVDLNYSEVIRHDESEFVVAGPGAIDGIAKMFVDVSKSSAEAVISMMMERQDAEFERLGLTFPSLWGRPLQLIDCQNLFCEISKYTRVSHPEIRGLSGRTRIKQHFQPQAPLPHPWYPPKWRLNRKIRSSERGSADLFAETL